MKDQNIWQSRKRKLKFNTVRSLSHGTHATHWTISTWATLQLTELAASVGEKKKHLLTPGSRDCGKCKTHQMLPQTNLMLTNMFNWRCMVWNSFYQIPMEYFFLLPASSLFYFLFFTFLFLFSFGGLFNKRYIKPTALKISLYDKRLELDGGEEFQRPCLKLSTKHAVGVS